VVWGEGRLVFVTPCAITGHGRYCGCVTLVVFELFLLLMLPAFWACRQLHYSASGDISSMLCFWT
jgi:hypothetical protein